MIYFSEFRGRKIFNLNARLIGKVDDLTFQASEIPYLTKILIKSKSPTKYLIPLSCLQKVGRQLIISNNCQRVELQSNELYVGKNLVDKQIIDLTGRKVVKVNDAVLQLNKEVCFLMGVDIGMAGILRWFKLEGLVSQLLKLFGRELIPRVLAWKDIQPLELSRGKVQLKVKEKRLVKLQPEDLADWLEQTNVQNIEKILMAVNKQFAANVIASLHLNYQVNLFRQFDIPKACQILQLIDPDEAVDILLALSKNKRSQILTGLTPDSQKQLLHLLHVSKTPIGSLMTNEYLTADPRETAKDIIKKIKKQTEDFSFLDYIYVLNQDKKLVGVFNLHELLLADLETPVYKFMVQDVVILHLTTPEEIGLKRMVKYQVHCLPVTDKDKHILGIVTYDNIARKILKNDQ